MLGLWEILLILGAAVAGAALAQRWLGPRRAPPPLGKAPPEPLTLLFHDGTLHHGTDRALRHFAIWPGEHDWQDLVSSLKDGFAGLPDQPPMGAPGTALLKASNPENPQQIELRWRDTLCWVSLLSPGGAQAGQMPPEIAEEVAALRLASDTSLHPVWHLDSAGQVCWQNPAYQVLAEMARGAGEEDRSSLFPVAPGEGPQRHALRMTLHDSPDWYEVTALKIGRITVCQASCINSLIKAEDAQREFVQTLAKTFANLKVGLAIFDRAGQLVLFNPALLDLTALPPEFLSTRPTLLAFFDRLREDRLMPEPKDYKSWREGISDLIASATRTQYQETWTLDDGRTLRVEGSPHPDGATAFLIEDISAEVALTRSFRSDIALGQAMIDTLEDALVVFTGNGRFSFCNAAYRRLWGHSPENTLVDCSVHDCIDVWSRRCASSTVWPEVAKAITNSGSRDKWDMPLYLKNGRELTVEFQGLIAGATVIRFKLRKQQQPPLALAEVEAQN